MKWLVTCVIFTACTVPEGSSSQDLAGVYRVTARSLAVGSTPCTDPGTPTDPAVPDRAFTAMGDALSYVWCDSPTTCDPVGTFDWFAPGASSCNVTCDGGNCMPLDCHGSGGAGSWTRASASVQNAPDNRIDCALLYETLTITRPTSTTLHLDVATHSQDTDPASCTIDRALALASDSYCTSVDHYDLAR